MIHTSLGDKLGIAAALDSLATLFQQEEKNDRATRLWAAASALRGTIGAPLPQSERDELEGEMAAAREVIGRDTFQAAWEEGGAWGMEEAVRYALEGTGSAGVG